MKKKKSQTFQHTYIPKHAYICTLNVYNIQIPLPINASAERWNGLFLCALQYAHAIVCVHQAKCRMIMRIIKNRSGSYSCKKIPYKINNTIEKCEAVFPCKMENQPKKRENKKKIREREKQKRQTPKLEWLVQIRCVAESFGGVIWVDSSVYHQFVHFDSIYWEFAVNVLSARSHTHIQLLLHFRSTLFLVHWFRQMNQ